MNFLSLSAIALAYTGLSYAAAPETPVLCPLVVNIEQSVLLPAGRVGANGLIMDLVPMGEVANSTFPGKIVTGWKPQAILQWQDPSKVTLYCFPKSTEIMPLPLTGVTLSRTEYPPTPNIGVKKVQDWVALYPDVTAEGGPSYFACPKEMPITRVMPPIGWTAEYGNVKFKASGGKLYKFNSTTGEYSDQDLGVEGGGFDKWVLRCLYDGKIKDIVSIAKTNQPAAYVVNEEKTGFVIPTPVPTLAPGAREYVGDTVKCPDEIKVDVKGDSYDTGFRIDTQDDNINFYQTSGSVYSSSGSFKVGKSLSNGVGTFKHAISPRRPSSSTSLYCDTDGPFSLDRGASEAAPKLRLSMVMPDKNATCTPSLYHINGVDGDMELRFECVDRARQKKVIICPHVSVTSQASKGADKSFWKKSTIYNIATQGWVGDFKLHCDYKVSHIGFGPYVRRSVSSSHEWKISEQGGGHTRTK